MAILRVRDNGGNVVAIPAIKGDKGDKGDPGKGVVFGSYTGNGMPNREILIDGYVYAVLIINQWCEKGVGGNGFTIEGGFVTKDNPLKYDSYAFAEVSNPVADTAVLYVRNYTYLAGEEGEYTIGLNKSGTAYHYIAFVE